MCATAAVSPNLAAALDRTSVSNRKAAYILHAAAKSYGQYPADMSLSVSSIQRSWSKHNMQAAAEAKASYVNDSHDGALVVHFDGKLLPAITDGPEKEERVAIVVTGLTSDKLLAF